MGGLLFPLAFVLLVAPSYETFLICAILGMIVGVVISISITTNSRALRFCWIISAALLVGYAGGVFLTWLNTATFAEFNYIIKYRPIPLLSATLALVYGCCGMAILAGRLERPIFEPEDLPRANGQFELILVLAALLCILVAYLSGDYGYGGIQVEQSTSRISAVGAIADLVAAPIAGICGYAFGRSRRRLERLFYGTCALICLVSIVPSGRRPIVLALLLLTIGFCMSGGLRRAKPLQLIVIAGAGIVFAYLTTQYFYALRLSAWELGPTSGLADQMSLALEFLVSPSLQERFSTLLSENIRERTFVLGYLADLVEATQKSGPLYGEALLFELRVAVPSALDPSKSAVLDYQQIENLVHPKLGLPVMDQANSVLTDGVTDFGAVGALIYMLGIIGLANLTMRVLRFSPTPISVLFGGLVLVHLGLKPEFTLSDYFVTIRNLLLLFLVLSVVEALAERKRSFQASVSVPRLSDPR